MAIVAFQLLLHWFYLEPSYNRDVSYDEQTKEFKPWEWRNPACDRYFKSRGLMTISNCLNPYQRLKNGKGKINENEPEGDLDKGLDMVSLFFSNKLLSHEDD